MHKMSILPDWHSLYPKTQKLKGSRPHSSPCRGRSKTGSQDLCRPSSSGECSQVVSTDTTYCNTGSVKGMPRVMFRYPPYILCGEMQTWAHQATFFKVMGSFKVNGQDLNPGWTLSALWLRYSVNDSCTYWSRPVPQ